MDVDADGGGQPRAVILVRLVEVAEHGVLDLVALYLAEIGGQVLDQIVLLMLPVGAIEFAGLAEIVHLVDRLLLGHAADPELAVAELWRLERMDGTLRRLVSHVPLPRAAP